MSFISSNIYRHHSKLTIQKKLNFLYILRICQNLHSLIKIVKITATIYIVHEFQLQFFLLHKKRFPGIFFTMDLFGVKSRQIMDFILTCLFDIRFQYQKHVLIIIGKSSTFSALYRYPISKK